MKKKHYFAHFLNALCLALPLLAMDPQENSLQKRWETEIENPKTTDERKLLLGKHVIFVGGIMNELASPLNFYFSDNIKTVENDLGGTASYLGPPSEISIPENAEMIYQFFIETYEREKKPLIPVGHSKGGAEILAALLMHPELILDGIVWQALLIQPAIGGSPLADDSSGFLLDLMMVLFSPNISTLTTLRANLNFDYAFIAYEEKLFNSSLITSTNKESLHQKISSKIFYVRSKTSPSEISLGTSLVLAVLQSSLKHCQEDHDGLLPVSSQFDRRIGKVLGTVESDHLGLTVSKISNVSKHDRKAFTRLIFRILAEEERK